MQYRPLAALPTIYINGSIGNEMNNSRDFYNISLWFNQSWNTDVDSYNVVGQLNGTDQDRTIIVDCLYDSWWNQGTADSAIGIGIILAIAKYYKENNIIPKYNLKLIYST